MADDEIKLEVNGVFLTNVLVEPMQALLEELDEDEEEDCGDDDDVDLDMTLCTAALYFIGRPRNRQAMALTAIQDPNNSSPIVQGSHISKPIGTTSNPAHEIEYSLQELCDRQILISQSFFPLHSAPEQMKSKILLSDTPLMRPAKP